MTTTLLLEQIFNGLQAGITLFLIAAGLTLILGIMDFVFFGSWIPGDDRGLRSVRCYNSYK
jgi:hypothetical protein